MWHEWRRGGTHKWFGWETLKERVNLETPEVGRVILKWLQTE
jgi:hypothetical protein